MTDDEFLTKLTDDLLQVIIRALWARADAMQCNHIDMVNGPQALREFAAVCCMVKGVSIRENNPASI